MRIKYTINNSGAHSKNPHLSLSMHFSPEEMSYMFKDTSAPKGYRMDFSFNEGLLEVRPIPFGAPKPERSWSIFPQESSQWPWKAQAAITQFPGINTDVYEDSVYVDTRKVGVNLHALLETGTPKSKNSPARLLQPTARNGGFSTAPAAKPAAKKPEPTPEPVPAQVPATQQTESSPAQSLAAMIGGNSQYQHHDPLVSMLENAYNVNPADRSVLKAALAIVNDNIKRSKGAIAAQIDPRTGEVVVSVAQFQVNMENL